MSSRELIEWEEFYYLEPWDDDVYTENLRWGWLLAMLENAHFRDANGKSPGKTAEDYFHLEPPSLEEPEPPTIEKQIGDFQKLALIFGGKVEFGEEWTQYAQQG